MKPFGGDFQSGCSDGGCVDAVNFAVGGCGNFQSAVKNTLVVLCMRPEALEVLPEGMKVEVLSA